MAYLTKDSIPLSTKKYELMVWYVPHHKRGLMIMVDINMIIGMHSVHCTLFMWLTLHLSVWHYDDVRMGAIASQITSLTIVYSIVYSDADQRKHQSSASLAFVRGIHRGPVNFPHKWPVTRKMFSFDDVIMEIYVFKYDLVLLLH